MDHTSKHKILNYKDNKQSIKESVINDFIKVSNFCSEKDHVRRMKRQATD